MGHKQRVFTPSSLTHAAPNLHVTFEHGSTGAGTDTVVVGGFEVTVKLRRGGGVRGGAKKSKFENIPFNIL
jgi:hypothetical protein